MKKKYTISLLSCLACALIFSACSENMDSNYASESIGKGGSMARFAISGDYLYTVDDQMLKTFDIADNQHPRYLSGKNQILGFNIETVFILDTLLFIGSQDGMYIYNITRPDFPNFMSMTQHLRSCDPVVASGNYAYVTLNTENAWCGGNANVLDVYDITDPGNPLLEKTIRLNYPKGLGVDGNKLFVCEKGAGIKVFDISDPVNPQWTDDLSYIAELQNIDTYDVIPLDGLLLVSGTGGFYQLDYSGEKIQFVSKIEVKKD